VYKVTTVFRDTLNSALVHEDLLED
jgi:hypothetical protein